MSNGIENISLRVRESSFEKSLFMKDQFEQICWIEEFNDHQLECHVELAIRSGKTDDIFLIVPGLDGSLDGFMNKYQEIVDRIHEKHNVTCVRMSNPFITSSHWETNLRSVLAWISATKMCVIISQNTRQS